MSSMCLFSFKRTGFAKEYSINYDFNCNLSNAVYLSSCNICELQYVGSNTTKFRTRVDNHKSRMRHHRNLDQAQREQDDLLYRHFWSDRLNGLNDTTIQLPYLFIYKPSNYFTKLDQNLENLS